MVSHSFFSGFQSVGSNNNVVVKASEGVNVAFCLWLYSARPYWANQMNFEATLPFQVPPRSPCATPAPAIRFNLV